MLTTDERKVILRAIRKEAIIIVSENTEDTIRKINESDILMRNLAEQIWENTIRRLRREGFSDLCERPKLADFDHHHRIRTILGSMRVAYEDLKESVPPTADLRRLQFWDAAWSEQKGKSKRMKVMDAETLPKRVRLAQDAAAASSAQADTAGTGAILRTVYNAQCTHLIGIPHEALVEGQTIGSGAFGEVKEYKIRGVSFLPEHITYCGKLYKGDGTHKFESFQTEQGMQVLHPSIVRCIAFTKESPWITIFPFYNGGSLGDMLLLLPFRHSEFTRAMFRMDQGWRAPPPAVIPLNQVQRAKVKQVILNMPHIMHALVDGLAAAHTAGIIHTDLHPFNIVLDFTRDLKTRVGIIDWGLLLRAPKKRASLNFVFDADKNPEKVAEANVYADRERPKRGWLAPELYDPFLVDAYTPASDVYALGYLLEVLHEFWKKAQELWMDNSVHDKATMEAIQYRVRNWMYLQDRFERKSILQVAEFFRSLNTEPARAQRPLVELTVSFMPIL